MSFCPQCGAATQPAMTFCTACGATLPPQAAPVAPVAPAHAAFAAPDATTAPRGAAGKMVAPWKAIVFPFLTLGIYVYVFWWRIAHEIDAYARSNASGLVRMGLGLMVLGLLGTILAAIQILLPVFSALVADPTSVDPETIDASDEYLTSPLYVGSSVLGFVGGVLLWMGLWRAWRALETDERQRSVVKPIDARVFVAILVAGSVLGVLALVLPGLGLLSFATFVATLWVMYTTQVHLNMAWVANGAVPVA